MITAIEALDPQCQNILQMLEELRHRKSPLYAKGLDSLLDRMPPNCDEADLIRQHRDDYIKELPSIPVAH